MHNTISSTPSAPYFPDPQNSYFTRQESWEGYLDLESTNNYALPSPAPGVSEVMFQKPPQSPQPMDEEEFTQPSGDQYYPAFIEDYQYSDDASLRGYQRETTQMTYEDVLLENEGSQCSKFDSEAEVASVSTKDSAYAATSGAENDALSFMDYTSYPETPCDLEAELTMRAMRCLKDCSDEEKQYIQKILPLLLSALKEIYQNYQLPLDDQIVGTILKELLTGKGAMLGAEQEIFRKMIDDEMNGVNGLRPEKKINEDNLTLLTRKEKKATKGHRNTSSMNHFNENYVSNIFQFARRTYPEDREVQKIGNERNVSASNFRKLLKTKMDDDIMTRKAKARIAGSGRELVQNIEHWMADGYFEQCSDREKYIHHKEKALRDLALSEQF